MDFPFSTLPGLVQYAGKTHRNPAALAHRVDGTWRTFSSEFVLDGVRRAGAGLVAWGLRPGDRVGIAASPSPYWLMADWAALGAGAITVPVFPNAAPENMSHQIAESGMRVLFVDTDARREALRPACGGIERVIVLRPEAGFQGDTWEKLLEEGESSGTWAAEWERRGEAVRPEDTATLIYTSGSTGLPKGVELTHGNIVSQVQGARRLFPLDPNGDRALSFLPLAHIFERMVSCYYVASGVGVWIASDPKKAGEDAREVFPTIITLVPRFLEKIRTRVREQLEAAPALRRALGTAALDRAAEKPPEERRSLLDRAFDALVYRKVRGALGGKVRLAICGSAPLDPKLAGFFLNLGIPLYEGYGLTECSPVLATNYPGHRKLGTVGRAMPGVEVRISGEGEVLARGPNIMKGYYRHPGATRETIDADGWLHTGDLGRLEDGWLTLTGRKKELFKTANGKYVAPVPIEQALAAHKPIDMALIIAEGRSFVTALVFPDFENLTEYKRSRGAGDLDDVTFLRSPELLARIQGIVESVNARLSYWEKIRKFHVVETPLTIHGGDMTPTLKLRRQAVEARFKTEIEGMYGEN